MNVLHNKARLDWNSDKWVLSMIIGFICNVIAQEGRVEKSLKKKGSVTK